ncbi:AI-2E family transporter [Azospirillum halopraeferens]|uniref:AI-2E family transporter n=1 Tax=Azospirillum halopraeferens TaxID=34010 RepID=UPI000414A2B9|nr:AI-2E family transporter [Azospirillum halopraeferens]
MTDRRDEGTDAQPADSNPADPPAPPAGPPGNAMRVAVIGLFGLAVLYTVYFGRDVLLPIALALLLSFLLRPVVRALYRLGIPEWLGAAVVVIALSALGLLAVYTLTSPAAQWIDRMPVVLRQIEFKLGDLRDSLDRAREATRELEQIASAASDTREVVVRGPTLAEQFLDRTRAFLANVVIMQVLLYFFLARGRATMEALIGTMRSIDDRVHYAMVAGTVQQNIAAYLATVTLINIGLGAVTALAMWLLGMPNAGLWGTLAGVANFIPFIGAAVMAAVLALVSLLTFDSPGAILLPPLVFIAFTALEGNFITPTIVGRRLSLNPIAVFISILFWGWMWGIPGALLAVPILAVIKILCDAHEPMRPAGAVLGQ